MPSSKKFRSLPLIVVFLLILQLVATTLLLPRSATAQTQTINPYGVNTFLEKEVENWKKEKTFQLISEAGIGWVKQEFSWDEIEFRKGYFYDDKFQKSSWEKFDQIVNLAVKYNINIVARLDRTPLWANPQSGDPMHPPANFQDYADFIKAFVTHYKGKINYIQVWNEPNLGYEWTGTPDAKKYVEMLKLAYQAAKSADPNIKVMNAPLAMTVEKGPTNLSELDFFSQMYQAGAKPYFDVIAANGYGLEFPPEDAPDPQKLNFRRVELLHDIAVKNGDSTKQVWFNEYGWNASPADFPADKLIWRRVTEQQQADYTVRGYKYARDNWSWSGVIFMWYFRQVGDITPDRSDYYFQMVTTDFKTKPVYDALKKDALAFINQKGLPTPVPFTPVTQPVTTTAAVATTQANTTAAVTTTKAVATTAAIAAPTQTSSSSSGSGDNSSALNLIIVGIVVLLVGGGGAAFYFIQQRNRQ